MTGKKSFQCSTEEVLFNKPPKRHLGVIPFNKSQMESHLPVCLVLIAAPVFTRIIIFNGNFFLP